jgi:hypothetical protein
VVDGAGEHPLELGLADARLEGRGLRGRLGDGGLVVLRRAEIEQDDGVVEVARELLDARDVLFDRRAPAGDDLRLLLLVPEPRGERQLLEPVDLCLELRQVKDAPLAP